MGLRTGISIAVGMGIGSGMGSRTGVPVFPLGDSYTEGLEGDTGGWRARLQMTGAQLVGPYTDPTGRRHGGRGGDMMVDASDPDMIDRFAAQWAASPSQEVWTQGGTNDLISGGDSTAALMVADAATLEASIRSTIGANRVSRWGTLPPTNTGSDATIVAYNRQKLHQMIAVARAAGNQAFLHDAGAWITTAGLSPGIVEHPTDTDYGVDGYGLWASQWDRYFNPALAVDPASIGVSLAYWYRADQVNLTGAAIDSFIDLSGNGRTLSPFNVANKAQQADGKMGQKCAAVTGDAYRLTGFEIPQPSTVFFVIDGVNATGSPAISDAATTGTTKRNLIQIAVTTGFVSMFAGTGVSDGELNATTVGHGYMCEFAGAAS